MPNGVVEPGNVLPAPNKSLVLAPMIGLMKREARPDAVSGSPRNRQPNHDPARAKMELFANDLLDIDHFSRGLKFFIFPQSNTSDQHYINHKV
jgi:hypothetical protein